MKPRLEGEAHLIRYADDFIVGFERASDAARYQTVLAKRLARFSLSVAEDENEVDTVRTLLPVAIASDAAKALRKTFDFLGFTHYCGLSRAGRFKLKRKTSTKKLRAKLLDLKRWFWKQLETPVAEMWRTLNAKATWTLSILRYQ